MLVPTLAGLQTNREGLVGSCSFFLLSVTRWKQQSTDIKNNSWIRICDFFPRGMREPGTAKDYHYVYLMSAHA